MLTVAVKDMGASVAPAWTMKSLPTAKSTVRHATHAKESKRGCRTIREGERDGAGGGAKLRRPSTESHQGRQDQKQHQHGGLRSNRVVVGDAW
jgi:hypothetical protein